MSTQKSIDTLNAAELAVLERGNRLVGAKQIRKAFASGRVSYVYLAADAHPAITEPLIDLCKLHSVEVAWVRSMTDLGNACGIEVGAAAAAVLSSC